MAETFLELRDVAKSFPGVVALDRVSFSVSKGEVIGLVGENGAGKSTLLKVLGGVLSPTSGAIFIDGEERRRLSVTDAIDAGIAFVHQELSVFENLDVAANVFIGREPRCWGPLHLVDERKTHALVAPFLEKLGADFGPSTLVADLSIAQRQLLEIAKALSFQSRVVIMDEPTSSLTLTETERLLKIVDDLRAEGVSVIYVTHRLSEITACADRVVALRDGRMVGELAKDEITAPAMIRLMIGRELQSLYTPPAAPPGEPILEIDAVRSAAYPESAVSLSVARGEILGLAGLIGSGRTELARAVFGVDARKGGAVRLHGRELAIASPRDAIAEGLFLAPEDRKQFGLFLDLPIAENVALPQLDTLSEGALVKRDDEIRIAEEQRRRLNIRAPSVEVAAGALSGGNQQKVVLSKWLAMQPKAVIFDEPTRGVDVGAKKEIYAIIRGLADAGVAILMISSDMEEVIGVSDRIAVMCAGRISGFLQREEFSEQNVLQLAIGQVGGERPGAGA